MGSTSPIRQDLGLDNELILWYLFGTNDHKPFTILDQRQALDICEEKCSFDRKSPSNASLNSHANCPLSKDMRETILNSYGCESFPPEVQLCWSSIPGKQLGVAATRLIPQGVWFGPFDGKLLDIGEVDKFVDRESMWEVLYQNQVRYFIDGTDFSSSSWLSFVQCARTKAEQNTSVFQHKGRVYYRSLRDIQGGEEILVWYGDSYEHYLGIPLIYQEKHDVCTRKRLKTRSKQCSPLRNDSWSKSSDIKNLEVSGKPFEENVASNSDEEEKPRIASHEATQLSSSCGNHGYSNHGYSNNQQKSTSSGHVNLLNEKTCHHGSSYHSNTSDQNFHDKNTDSFARCTQCCKTFSRRTLLQAHRCSKQTNLPYHCGKCPSLFASLSGLTSHVVHHMGEKPFKCGFCNRSFVGITTLNNHVQLHMGRGRFGASNRENNKRQERDSHVERTL